MIAVCGFCKALVTPEQAPVPSFREIRFSDAERLQQAALYHLGAYHEQEVARALAAGNLLTLWIATAYFTISGQDAGAYAGLRAEQAGGIRALLEADDQASKEPEAAATETV